MKFTIMSRKIRKHKEGFSHNFIVWQIEHKVPSVSKVPQKWILGGVPKAQIFYSLLDETIYVDAAFSYSIIKVSISSLTETILSTL